jgi:hypothetical protein
VPIVLAVMAGFFFAGYRWAAMDGALCRADAGDQLVVWHGADHADPGLASAAGHFSRWRS